MPKPRSVRDSEKQDGPSASAFFAPEEPAAAVAPAAPRWEQLHKRWTFHAPVDVLEAVDAEARRSGRTKTAVVVELLRAGLNVPGPKTP